MRNIFISLFAHSTIFKKLNVMKGKQEHYIRIFLKKSMANEMHITSMNRGVEMI